MAKDTCQCPDCGRAHRLLGFGKPPESIASPHADLMKFYGVTTVAALIEKQDQQIARLQEAVRRSGPPPFRGAPAYPVRQG